MPDILALSADEAKFFETGELPSALTPEPVAPAADAAPATPAPTAAPAAAPATPSAPPRDDKGRFTTAAPDNEMIRLLADAEARNADALAKLTALQARVEELSKPAPKPAPDRNLDPLGYLEHQIAEQTRLLTELRAEQAQHKEQATEADAQRAFVNSVHAMRAEFIKTTPDYDAAYAHLRNARLEELSLLGFDSRAAQQQLAQEEFAIAAAEVRRGRNPVATIYDLAKKRGYTPPAAPAATQTPEDKLAAIRAAAEAAKTVERGGLPTDAELTLATARNASPAQLDKLAADRDAWSKFTGTKTSIF